MNLKKAIILRSWVVFLMILFLAISVIWQMVSLQINGKEKYSKIKEEQSTKWRDVVASRGNIYAADGSLLATSVPRYEIRIDTRAEGLTNEIFDKNIDSLSWYLSNILADKSSYEYKIFLTNARNKKERYLLLKRDIDYLSLKKLQKCPIFNLGKYKGGFIKIEKNKREYPFGNLAYRTIGYTNEAGIKIGLEGAYDSILKGSKGKRLEQRVAGNVWKPVENGKEFESKNGLDIYTTIDVNIQDVAQNALKEALINNNAKHGCVIVMEVETGAIKAISSLKKNENNEYKETENLAINEFSDPGSTFKLVSTLALLEEKAVKLEDTIDIEWGKTKFGIETMEDAHTSPFKEISYQSVFENSSNVGIAKTVVKNFKNKPEKFIHYLNSLGLNQPLNFEIKSSNKPYIKNTKDKLWSKTSLPWMSIGYEMKVSALQILNVYNAVANNGKMISPYLVEKISDYGKVVYQKEINTINKKICSDETLIQLKKLLEGVVVNGTGKILKNTNYSVAAKTGTAQIALNSSGYDKSSHKASIVGYFPANKPKYSCIVVINSPSMGLYYGGEVAGPVFKEIADKIFSTNLSLHNELEKNPDASIPQIKNGNRNDIKLVLNKLSISSHLIKGDVETEWIKAFTDGKTIDLNELKVDKNKVPNVIGMGIKDALFLLENKGLKVKFDGVGSIKSQSIEAGSIIVKGSYIYLKLSL